MYAVLIYFIPFVRLIPVFLFSVQVTMNSILCRHKISHGNFSTINASSEEMYE